MKIKFEFNIKNLCFTLIVLLCVLALSYGIYYQVVVKSSKSEEEKNNPVIIPDVEFGDLFNNNINLQGYTSANFVNRLDSNKEIVYTTYTLNEIYEGKYEIQASIPIININHENAINIDKEITSVFYNKINSIIDASKKDNAKKSIYTVTYSAYLNENILSLVIRVNLKEGDDPQRLIIKSYTYNLSTNREMSLREILEIKDKSEDSVQTEITNRIGEAINYSNNMASLGYEVYQRDKNSDIYRIENSDNYFLGPNGCIYIIYAYGNSSFTTESDIVYIK